MASRATAEVIDLSQDSDDDCSFIDLDENATPEPLSEDEFQDTEDFLEELTVDEFNLAISSPDRHKPSVPWIEPALTSEEVKANFNIVTIETCTAGDGFHLKTGMFVELFPDTLNQREADFILIESIHEDLATDEVFLKGTRFRRTNRLKGMLEKKLNEIYMIQRHNLEDPHSIHQQSLEKISTALIMRPRTIILTNQLYPNLSYRTLKMFRVVNSIDVRENAQLVCRYKYTITYSSTVDKKARRVEEHRLERLSAAESHSEYAISDQQLFNFARSVQDQKPTDLTSAEVVTSYRDSMQKQNKPEKSATDYDDIERPILEIQEDELSGAHRIVERFERVTTKSSDGKTKSSVRVSREETFRPTGESRRQENEPVSRNQGGSSAATSFPLHPGSSTTPGQASRTDSARAPQYTFADGFAGAGGISSGARAAHLKIVWAFDMWLDAHNTYRLNFPGVKASNKKAYDFIVEWKNDRTVDILHLSPPCQTFSPVHTVAGKNDDDNEASLFAVGVIIQKTRPRVVTIEETSGIQSHHPIFLHALILQLTHVGYSVSWKVMNFAEYGLAQPRKRLIIIASCPGEPLPPYPTRTHGPGLKPFATIRSATQSIRPWMPNQDINRCAERNAPSYDPNVPHRHCITCKGGEGNVHWSGKRSFTERELASLQGFPTDHVFTGTKTSVVKQIGNAVPPLFAKQLFRSIITTLRATDAARVAVKEEESMGVDADEGAGTVAGTGADADAAASDNGFIIIDDD